MERTDFIDRKKLNRLILLVLWAILLFSCDSTPQRSEHGGQKSQIVLIVKDSLVGDFLTLRKGVFKYIDEELFPAKIEFFGDSLSNNGIIKTKREFLELVYQDKNETQYSYLFQKGDTVLIKLNEQSLWMETVNRKTSPHETNLEFLRNRDLYQSTYTNLQDFYFFWNAAFASVIPVELEDELEDSRKEAIESLNAALSWIDSLRSEEQISEKIAGFYASKTRFELEKLKFFADENGVFDAQGAIRYFLGSEWDHQATLKNVYMDEFAEFLLTHDTLEESVIQGAPFITENGTPFGQLLLFKYLNQTLPFISLKEADEWLNRFGDHLNNPAQRDFLKARQEALSSQRADMDLMGIGSKHTGFEDLLDQKKGNYLYIDLWAAWCIPCIQSFPASRALHEAYKDRGFEVVYLSIDKNHTYWENVLEKYDISIPNRSFSVRNVDESRFLKVLQVEGIPRYLLFDKEGQLIHPNAPRPESEEIRILFDKLISG